MTPIGHFMCAAAVAGCSDVTSKRETSYSFLYYAIFLALFGIFAAVLSPGKWAMYFHDWAGNIALLYFFFAWRKDGGKKGAFVLLLIGGQVLSAYTHAFDSIFLWRDGFVPEGFYRPHNILHTPLAIVVVPLIALIPVRLIVKNVSLRLAYFSMVLGYLMHVVADSVTYDYPLYLLWPVNDFSASLVSLFRGPDSVSAWLGNPLYLFETGSAANTDGYIVYKAELFVNAALAFLFGVKCAYARLLGEKKDGG